MAPPGPPMPVPSKAAIRALRGLVLGTTCTLALVTEDRRRRINAARSAIRNGDRIRAARRYHPGGSAFAFALEEDSSSVEPAAMNWKAPTRQGQSQPNDEHRENTIMITSQRTATTMGNWPEATLGPSRTDRSSSPSRQQTERSSTASSESSSRSRTQTTTTSSSATSPSTSPSEPQPPIFAYPPPAGERIQRPIPSLAYQAEEYRARARAGRRIESSIVPVGRVNPTQPAIALSEAMADQVKALVKPIRTKAELEAAVRTLIRTWPIIDAASDQTAIAKTSAELCRLCLKARRMDLAQVVLKLAVKFGQLDEATYFAHNPLRVVKSMLPLKALKAELADPYMEADGADARRDAFVKHLKDAASLFLPTFMAPHTPDVPLAEIVALGKQLLKCAFTVFHHELINTIYTSIAKYPGDITELSKWYIEKMQLANDHALFVSSFVTRPPTVGSLTKTALLDLGGLVAECSRLDHHTKAGAVLKNLIDVSAPPKYRLHTASGTDLLYGEWRKNKDYARTKRLFVNLISPRTDGEEYHVPAIYHINGAYRVMVQIALEADKPTEAKALYDELLVFEPTANEDIRIVGLFALAKAKAGDWQGVQDDFQKAADAAANKGGLDAGDAERVFVPIAKEYIRTHTIGETEDFLKLYIHEVGVPIGRYMVSLVANEYGALREVRSFVAWLDYCAQAGFVMDAAFSNAILHSCRKYWRFGWNELRTMYRKLRLLSPNFDDKMTQNIMAVAAISDAKSIKRSSLPTAIRNRIMSLGINNNSSNSNAPRATAKMATLAAAGHHINSSYTSPPSTSRHLLNEHDLHLAMKQAFLSGAHTKVVRMYKQAVRGGLPPSDKCLQLAVSAAIKSDQSMASSSPVPTKTTADFDVAVDLLKTAYMAGQSIDAAAAYLAIAYIDTLGTRTAAMSAKNGKATAKASIAAIVKSVLLRLDACDIRLTDFALNRAAFHMFKAGHMSGAIALAMSAANSPVGGGRPGYNVWNFSVLMVAHSCLADAEGIRAAMEGAAASGVLHEPLAFKAIKRARRRLQTKQIEHELAPTVHGHSTHEARKRHDDDIKTTLKALDEALHQVREVRRQLGEDRRALETMTINIMQQAVLAAGQAPVDFDEGRKPKKKRAQQQQQQQQHKDGSSSTGSVNSGSSWDLLDMPINDDGELIDHLEPPTAASTAEC